MNQNNKIYQKFGATTGQIAVLIDPDVTNKKDSIRSVVEKAEFAQIDYIFVGGSSVTKGDFEACMQHLKELTKLPIVIFPGDLHLVSEQADAVLYLSLLSGRNPEYLISQHVKTAQDIFAMDIEVIPTGYILVDGGSPASVASISQTIPIARENFSAIMNTAIAGVLQGKKAIYFEAGSGAKKSIPSAIIKEAKEKLNTIILVGGGIRSVEQIEVFKNQGANIVVIGTKIEEDTDFLLDIRGYKNALHS
ncbi:MAG: geranylgeranylglyceryl/heptaprenylglyceryl phosphate synthase [Brumimicrobium sp.]